MDKIAVIYASRYGTTKQYAEWIAKALHASLLEVSAVSPAQLMEFDLVLYGGGLYAGGIAGVKLVTKNPCKSLIVFTVGLAQPNTTDYSAILAKNFTPEQLAKIKVFHLRGGIDYKRLGFVHKIMMAVMKGSISSKRGAKLSDEDQYFLETYGKSVYFTDECTIEPILAYAKETLTHS